MNNIGEELALGYFRIQGFFLLPNFVIHRTFNDERGECDILALRLRNMKESIYFKDQPEKESSFDYSDKVLNIDGLDLSKDVYLWIEVTLRKDVSKEYADAKFSDSKCAYVVERLGIHDWIDTDQISNNSSYVKSENDKVFAKVIICENMQRNLSKRCFYASFDLIREELRNWFRRYKEIKGRDWHAWVNPVLQGLAKQII